MMHNLQFLSEIESDMDSLVVKLNERIKYLKSIGKEYIFLLVICSNIENTRNITSITEDNLVASARQGFLIEQEKVLRLYRSDLNEYYSKDSSVLLININSFNREAMVAIRKSKTAIFIDGISADDQKVIKNIRRRSKDDIIRISMTNFYNVKDEKDNKNI